jgi:ComF family protein
MFKRIIKEIISYPCLNCGNKVAEKYGFCHHCFKDLPFILKPQCPGCGAENDGIFELCSKCLKEEKRHWTIGISLMRMEGTAQKLIHHLKYSDDTALARAMGKIAADKIADSLIHPDCIVPIPLHWRRRLKRGYNQTNLIAQIISKQLDIPLVKLLKRVKATPRQAQLDRKQRLKNLDGAFAVTGKKHCGKLKILLIDDVMTTGTTLNAAAETLISAGADEVNVLAILRA